MLIFVGEIKNEFLSEEIWEHGGCYYLRQEWFNGHIFDSGVNYNWTSPNTNILDENVYFKDVETLEARRMESKNKTKEVKL